jgi:hypothetical protein
VISPSLAYLAGTAEAHVNPADADKIATPDDGNVRLVGVRGPVRLPLRRDPAVPRGTVFVPFNRGGSEISTIIDAAAGATDVRIEAQ